MLSFKNTAHGDFYITGHSYCQKNLIRTWI